MGIFMFLLKQETAALCPVTHHPQISLFFLLFSSSSFCFKMAFCQLPPKFFFLFFFVSANSAGCFFVFFIYTVVTESIQTPLNVSLFVILQPFAKII